MIRRRSAPAPASTRPRNDDDGAVAPLLQRRPQPAPAATSAPFRTLTPPGAAVLARQHKPGGGGVPDGGSQFELKFDLREYLGKRVTGSLRVTFTAQRSSTSVKGDAGKASALDRKVTAARNVQSKWAAQYSARLAKAETTLWKEPLPGVNVLTDVSALEARFQEGKPIEIALLKVGVEVNADITQIAAPDEWSTLAKDHGFMVRVAGRLEFKLTEEDALRIAKMQAARDKGQKLAQEATELAEKNKAAVEKLSGDTKLRQRQLEAARSQRNKMVSRHGRNSSQVKKLDSQIAKLEKRIANNGKKAAELGEKIAAKRAAAVAVDAEMKALQKELQGPIARAFGKAVGSSLGKLLLKLAGGLGIALTVLEVGVFIYNVARWGVDPGFHDKGSGSKGGPGGDEDGGGGGADEDFDENKAAAELDLTEPDDAGKVPLHTNAQAVADAMGVGTPGKNMSSADTDIAALNYLVPGDLSKEELKTVVDDVKASGAKTVSQASSTIQQAVDKTRQAREAANKSTPGQGGESKDPKGGSGGGEGDGQGKVRKVGLHELRLKAGFDPDKPPKDGTTINIQVGFQQSGKELVADLQVKYLHAGGTTDTDTFFFENLVQWEKEIDKETVFIAAGTSLQFSWPKRAGGG